MKANADMILDRISEAAAGMGENELQTRMENIKRAFIHSNKLRLTIIGQHFNELPEILSCLVGKPELFSRNAARTNRSFSIEAFYSESEQYKVFMNGVDAYNVTKEAFEKSLSQRDDNEVPFCAEIYTNAPLLKVMDIHVVCSGNDFIDFDWISVLAESDYVVFVLKADALLSATEKRFIREVLETRLDSNRYALLVNHFERVREEEKDDVDQFLNSFLSSLVCKLPVYLFSAQTVLECLKTGNTIPEQYFSFLRMVRDDLAEKTADIHQQAVAQTMKTCIGMLAEAVKRSKEGLSADREKIDAVIRSLHEKEQTIQKRMDSLGRKIDIFINGSVKTDFQRKMEEFNEALVKSTTEDILGCEDIGEARRKLQSYLEYAWTAFFSNQEAWLKNRIFAEMGEIQRVMADDMKAFLEDMDAGLGSLLAEQLGSRYSLTVFIPKKRERDTVSNLTRYMNLGALGLTIINFPWALITLGASQLLRFIFKDSIAQGEREAMAKAVTEGCQKLKKQITAQIDAKFSEIIKQLQKTAQDSYQEVMASFFETLEQKKANIENADELQRKLDHIEQQVIPELNGLLAQYK